MTSEEYIEQRLQDQINWYGKKSQTNQKKFKALRFTEIVAAALIPFLSAFSIAHPAIATFLTITVGILGIVIAVIAGLLSLGRYQEIWVEYRTICESLKKEKYLFETKVEPFNEDNAFNLLVQRAETLISKENTNWAQYMMNPPQEKKDVKN